jgi:hypothetical protein
MTSCVILYTLVFPDGNFFIFFNSSYNHASCCSQMVKGVMKTTSTIVCRMWCQCYPEVAVLELSWSSCARICPNCLLENLLLTLNIFICFYLWFCSASELLTWIGFICRLLRFYLCSMIVAIWPYVRFDIVDNCQIKLRLSALTK